MNTENYSYEVNVVRYGNCTKKILTTEEKRMSAKFLFSPNLHAQIHGRCLRGELVVC